jgi:cytochrome c oxidase subunit IV
MDSARTAHPTPRQYVMIAAILTVLTALEVSLFYLDIGGVNTFALVVLMLLKFTLVVAFYMHLRYESGFLRRLFTAGLAIAGVVYLVVILTFISRA